MNLCARLIAACFLMVAAAGCSQASLSTPTTPTVTVTVTQSPSQSPSQVPLASHGPTSASATSVPQTEVGVCITPVVTCRGELKTEPSQIILSGDGTAFVTGLLWTGWGSNGATGSGTLKLDNCNPNCAQGGFTDYQATIVLSDLTGYVGGAAYATMMVAAPGSPFGTRTYRHLAP